MTVVDYNKVISAITMSIHNIDEWKDIDIYKEKDNEEINTPRIFVWTVNITESGKRTFKPEIYEVVQMMQVRYYPDENSTTKYQDCLDFAHKLKRVLMMIDVDDSKLRGSNINFNIDENILKFYVEYSYRTFYRPDEIAKMMQLQENYYLKGER